MAVIASANIVGRNQTARFAQSDRALHCPLTESMDPLTFECMRIFETIINITLTRLCNVKDLERIFRILSYFQTTFQFEVLYLAQYFTLEFSFCVQLQAFYFTFQFVLLFS